MGFCEGPAIRRKPVQPSDTQADDDILALHERVENVFCAVRLASSASPDTLTDAASPTFVDRPLGHPTLTLDTLHNLL